MSMNPSIAERIAFGRPVTAENDLAIHSVPRPATALVGRILLSGIFFVAGYAKLTDTASTAGYMASVGIPASETLAVVAGIAEIAGAISIATGFLARIGGLGLILFLIPTTLLFHAFWTFEGAEAQTQMINFLKNLAVMGGLALLVAHGAGRYSVDGLLRRPQDP